MLITNLGQTRQQLLASFRGLTDTQLNQTANGDAGPSIAAIVHHLHVKETNVATAVMEALSTSRGPVAERDLAALEASVMAADDAIAPLPHPLTRAELIELLERSRFGRLQRVFNETHASTLAEKSIDHPVYGPISLKNLVDTVWLHERRHIRQIGTIRQSL